MDARIFDTTARFAMFLRVQYRFHRCIAPLYEQAALHRVLPGMPDRRRLAAIEQDLADLYIAPPCRADERLAGLPLPVALGWLYVAEGSTLGGAVIFRHVSRLGLHARFGAGHLAPPPEGVAPRWRRFTAALDAVALARDEEPRVDDGACDAFAAVGRFVAEECA